MITFIEKEFKSILNVRKFIDSWFWDKYSINPYNGCQFGCIYCDSRSEKYHLQASIPGPDRNKIEPEPKESEPNSLWLPWARSQTRSL